MPANDRQEGGNHYKQFGEFQPWDVLRAWLTPEEYRGFMKGTMIAYLARERSKGGDLDMRKVMHYAQKFVEVLESAKQPATTGGIHPVAYTVKEGEDWNRWLPAWKLAPEWQVMRKDREEFVHIPLFDGQMVYVHAIKFSNGRIWDCVVGWRDGSK